MGERYLGPTRSSVRNVTVTVIAMMSAATAVTFTATAATWALESIIIIAWFV